MDDGTATPGGQLPPLLPLAGIVASYNDGALNVAVHEYAQAYAREALRAQVVAQAGGEDEPCFKTVEGLLAMLTMFANCGMSDNPVASRTEAIKAVELIRAALQASRQPQPQAQQGVSDKAVCVLGNQLAQKHAVYLTKESVRALLETALATKDRS